MAEYVEDMVCVLPSGGIIWGGGTFEVMVCDRPGGAAPKMLEKAASRW